MSWFSEKMSRIIKKIHCRLTLLHRKSNSRNSVSNDPWRIQRGPRGHGPPHPWHQTVWRKAVRLLSSWLGVSTLIDYICFVYSPPGKIMFSTLFSRNTSTFDWATVSLECQTGQAFWTFTVQKQILRLAGECIKIRISRPQNEKNAREGTLPSPTSMKRGHLLPIPHPINSRCPSALDLAP